MTGLAFGSTAYGAEGGHYGDVGQFLTPDHTFMLGRSRADGLVPPLPDFTIGETTTFELLFMPDGLPNHRKRYNQVRDRIMYANDDSVYTDTNFDSTPWFTERHRNETLLVRCEPGRDLDEVRGVWGIIRNGSDDTHFPGSGATLSVDVYVLAEFDNYETRFEVRNTFER